MSVSPEQQLSQLRTKYDNEVKKNNNLLKMNSNLMKENQLYQNCFSILKNWNQSFMSQFRQDQNTLNDQEINDSCIDIQEEGEEFVKSFTENIEKRFQQLLKEKQEKSQILRAERDLTEQSISQLQQQHQCTDCQRWKQLYIKETKQTQRLQKLVDQSSLLTTQKQLSIVKLKDDVRKLLDDYLNLYKKQLENMQKEQNQKESEIIQNQKDKISNRETVRIKDIKSKEKRQASNGSKPKKVVTNQSAKEQNMFLKDKTGKNTNKYSIQLNSSKQEDQKDIQNFGSVISLVFSEKINSILCSYSEVSNFYQKQNTLLKEKLRDFNQILAIYREKERNRILFK